MIGLGLSIPQTAARAARAGASAPQAPAGYAFVTTGADFVTTNHGADRVIARVD